MALVDEFIKVFILGVNFWHYYQWQSICFKWKYSW